MPYQREDNESSMVFSKGENDLGYITLPKSQGVDVRTQTWDLQYVTCVIAFKIQTNCSTDNTNM